MKDKNVKEPFVKVYDLKGLKAIQSSFLCKVWSFQSNGQYCYMSNAAWAEYLGCSLSTVGRLKKDLKELKMIDTDDQYVRMRTSMDSLIQTLNEHYIPRYTKKTRRPFWDEPKPAQNESEPVQNEQLTADNERDNERNEPHEVQKEDQLDKNKKNENKIHEIPLVQSQVWEPGLFQYVDNHSVLNVLSTTDKIIQRNILLSFWYSNVSEVEIRNDSLNYFNNDDIFNAFQRLLTRFEEGRINIEYIRHSDINNFLILIHVVYTDNLTSTPEGQTLLLRNVVDDIENIVILEENNFVSFLMGKKI
jgi:hypothetical protein